MKEREYNEDTRVAKNPGKFEPKIEDAKACHVLFYFF